MPCYDDERVREMAGATMNQKPLLVVDDAKAEQFLKKDPQAKAAKLEKVKRIASLVKVDGE